MATPRKPARNEMWKAKARDERVFDGSEATLPDPRGNRRQRRAALKTGAVA